MQYNINDGHTISGFDGGAVSNGIREQDLTRMVGNLVRIKLKARGHSVTNCSVDSASSVRIALNAISTKSNAVKCDLFISIHFNASNGLGHGTEVFTYNAKELKPARDILNNIVKLGFTNRGIKDGSHLAVIKNTNAPAMLIECAFIDSKSDMKLLSIEKMSDAIVNGLIGVAPIVKPVVKPIIKPIVKPTQLYKIQVGAYKSKEEADKAVAELKAKGIESFVKLV